jgi:predicted secreted protein
MNGKPESSEALTPQPSESLDVDGKAGEVTILPLGSGPATGYAWRLDLPEGVDRLEDGPALVLDPSVRLGGTESGCLRVAAPSGDYVIIARLARPWEPHKPARVVRIHLHVT